MSDQSTDPANPVPLLERALARWDSEGGAIPHSPQVAAATGDQIPMPKYDVAEVGALHIRMIALENLVIALLTTASDQQLDRVREMACFILPRSGFTHHPLTTHATAHMIDLVERASRFRPPLQT